MADNNVATPPDSIETKSPNHEGYSTSTDNISAKTSTNSNQLYIIIIIVFLVLLLCCCCCTAIMGTSAIPFSESSYNY